MRHAVIMAGGAGVRLWPLSRRERPKQVLRFLGGRSLLRQSYERVAALFPPERIHVITNQTHLPLVTEEIPEIPAGNLYGEPVGRDTANAVGLAAAVLHEKDPEAVIGTFTADHVIAPQETFNESVLRAFAMAEENADALVTLGVRPTRPDINYGYVQRGERLREGVYAVERFVEKPNYAAATKYVASGEYYWNSGMFCWRAATILDQLRKHLPQSHASLTEIARAWRTDERQTKLQSIYPKLMRISIDFAVMERADRVLVVALNGEWVDVGSWPALEAVLPADADNNISACSHVIHLGSRFNIVVSEEKHLIATIGVDDLVIVHSPNATLICRRRDAQAIKELVDNVRQQFGEEFT
jgi:mannose-1-phosphate guanylyltransferase